VRERLANVERGLEARDLAVAELRGEWGEAIAEGLRNGELQTEAGCDPGPSREPAEPGQQSAVRARDGAMRTIERHVKAGDLSAQAADRVDGVLRGGDAGLGLDARDIEAAGSTEYESAFHKLLKFGDGAVMRMSREEMAAVQATNRAEEMRTALTVGSGAGGGFAIPIAIDPTVNLSSSGAITRSVGWPRCGPCRPASLGSSHRTASWRSTSQRPQSRRQLSRPGTADAGRAARYVVRAVQLRG
jgi:hypothetical protein